MKSLGGKGVPIAGAIIGGFMDTSQMKRVLDYADIFYHKRFILEKEIRVEKLKGNGTDIIEAEYIENE